MYPTDDIVMIRKVRLAILAAVNLVGIEVDVVRQAHVGGRANTRLLS
jgi:hypothetical protein